MNVILFAVDIYTDLLTQKALSSLLNLRLSVKEITVMPNTAYLRYLCTYTYFHVPITSFHYIFFFQRAGVRRWYPLLLYSIEGRSPAFAFISDDSCSSYWI